MGVVGSVDAWAAEMAAVGGVVMLERMGRVGAKSPWFVRSEDADDILGRNKIARPPGEKEGNPMKTFTRGLRRSISAAAVLAALAFGAQVSANEVTADVEVDSFIVVAMDAASSEVVGDVEVTDITSVTIVDGAEEVVTTVEYTPVFTDAPVEVDAYLPIETEEPVVPATEIPVIVDGVEETPVTPEAPVEAPVEVDPIIPLEEEPVVDPAEEPTVPSVPVTEEPVIPSVPVTEEPVVPVVPVVEEPVVPSTPATEEPSVPSVPVVEEPVVPTTPATEAPVAPAAVRIPFTGAVLPNTGETSSVLAVLGFVVLAAAAFVASRKRA